MTAADVVVHKAILADDLRTPKMVEMVGGFIESAQSKDSIDSSAFPRTSTGPREVEAMSLALEVGENFWVSPEMITLAIHASLDMPDEPLLPFDLPSTHGFLWLPISYRQIDIRRKALSVNAVLWATRGGRVRLWLLTHKYDPDDSVNVILRAKVGEQSWRNMPTLTVNHVFELAFGQPLPRGISWDTPLPPDARVEIKYSRGEDGSHTLQYATDYAVDITKDAQWVRSPVSAFLVTIWRLMQQTLATRTTEVPNIRLARILRKANLPQKQVTIITLRRQSHEHGETQVEWSHRWVVRGHWRRQPCKDADGTWTHRMVYINPYIKGPDDAPLLVREHVNALSR